MQRYFLSKLGQSVMLIFGVLLLVFAMVRVTGDPATLMMSREASPEDLEAFRERMGFNDPVHVQFGRFMSGAVVGDFGNSLHFKSPAMPMVLERLPATLQLAASDTFFSLLRVVGTFTAHAADIISYSFLFHLCGLSLVWPVITLIEPLLFRGCHSRLTQSCTSG